MPRILHLLLLSASFTFLCASPCRADDGPVMTVNGTGIPETVATGSDSIVDTTVFAGAPLEYCWTATATAGAIETTRYGWNVMDPNDPDDPGWTIPATTYDGSERCSDVQQFQQGSPNFAVQVTDSNGAVTRLFVRIEIDQSVARADVTWGAVKAKF